MQDDEIIDNDEPRDDAAHDSESPAHDAPEPVPSRLLAEAVRARALELDAATRKRISLKKAFSPENVHETRVATKTLRALWQLVRPVIEPQIARNANERLRDMARSLAGARDAQVLTDLLADLRDADEPLYHGTFDRAGQLFATETDLDEHAAALKPALLAAIDADRDDWKTLVLPDDRALIEHGLGRVYAKTKRRADTAARTNTHRDFHRWRRWVKYLRYQLEALVPEDQPPGIAERIADLRKLGRTLGLRNDLAVLGGRLRELGEGDPFGAVFRAIELRDNALATRIPEVAERLFTATPEEFTAAVQSDLYSRSSEAE